MFWITKEFSDSKQQVQLIFAETHSFMNVAETTIKDKWFSLDQLENILFNSKKYHKSI
jgi:hypothetical protein